MKIITKKSLYDCKSIILDGGIMAYPTESVFGLGCDPFNKQAIDRLKQIKSRNGSGIILITESWNSVSSWIEYDKSLHKLDSELPTTWIFNASSQAPKEIIRSDNTIAIRKVTMPLLIDLCKIAGPITSTSANFKGEKPAATYNSSFFQKIHIEAIINEPVLGLNKPSKIIKAESMEVIRD